MKNKIQFLFYPKLYILIYKFGKKKQYYKNVSCNTKTKTTDFYFLLESTRPVPRLS